MKTHLNKMNSDDLISKYQSLIFSLDDIFMYFLFSYYSSLQYTIDNTFPYNSIDHKYKHLQAYTVIERQQKFILYVNYERENGETFLFMSA
jgi:hypothetical protein